MDAGHGCGCILDRLHVAERLLKTVVQAGAGRHVVATAAVALFKAAAGEAGKCDSSTDPEV